MKMVASTTRKKVLDFLNYGNHTSIKQKLEKTFSTMSKEDRNQYLIPLPRWLVRFIKHLHVTLQGILIKKTKTIVLFGMDLLPRTGQLLVST